jgi:hypothetical protein
MEPTDKTQLADTLTNVEEQYTTLSQELKTILESQISNCKQTSDIHREEVSACLGNVKRSADLLVQIIENFQDIQQNMQGVRELAKKTAALRAQCQQIASSLNITIPN